ncbi:MULTISPECIES: FecCD family ABC transporter permease [Acinetobacter]|uniref:FecCD family ABC transporter permease n=1 Tax=Acinetobacter TaxID=469 RepID=UPI000A3C363A|nr:MULTISPECIES: iron ABC transporter permease [Acinetobacter]MCZ1177610.1 iron ABC transporter permease [Acinetobacter pittii]MDA3452052.1 iron ABC transporter permease [Acinetobacter sp. AOR43_HL]OTU23899.1 iron transporter [Acinetobacter pittii]OTU50801.1 iron transporter [Acinetobacter pittii]QDB81892.1 iron ABC transporter permease [Acinetobacter pittii]
MEKMKYYWFYPLPFLMTFISLLIGPTQTLSAWDYLRCGIQAVFGTPYFDAERFRLMQNIIVNVRLPRILLTFMVGAALATAGNGLQALFRNPLVDSYVLGISSGAAFGAALALSLSWLSPNLSAFIFGVCAVGLTYLFAHQKHESQTSLVMVILSGMIVSGLFLAGLTIIQYLSDPFKLQAIVQWTMGNLHQASWQKVQYAVLPICIGLAGLFAMRWRLNLMALGAEEAQAVGVNPRWEQLLLIALVTVCTSTSVAAAGIISLYGLFMPHIVRMLVGPDHRYSIPANMVLGGSFLLMIDNFSRVLLTFEIPIGIFTMLLGAPFFLLLMKTQRTHWA